MSVYAYYIITPDGEYYVGQHLSEAIQSLKWMKQYKHNVVGVMRIHKQTREKEIFTLKEFNEFCSPSKKAE